jgi:hypothetical protein
LKQGKTLNKLLNCINFSPSQVFQARAEGPFTSYLCLQGRILLYCDLTIIRG